MNSIYIGNGQKYQSDEFFLMFPYSLHMEPVDRTEEEEPNPIGCEEVDSTLEQSGKEEVMDDN